MAERKKRSPCPVCGSTDPGEDPCCNPECNGDWGTNCYHCHYAPFLTMVEAENIPDLVERVKKYARAMNAEEIRRKERERCADLCDEEAESIGSGPIMAFRACAKMIRELAEGYIPRPKRRAGDRKNAPDPKSWTDIIDQILYDLTDRRGLRQSWESIDEDVRDEIKSAWTDIACRGVQYAQEQARKKVLRRLYGRFGYDEIAVPDKELDEQTIWKMVMDERADASKQERDRIIKALQGVEAGDSRAFYDARRAIELAVAVIERLPESWSATEERSDLPDVRKLEKEQDLKHWCDQQDKRNAMRESVDKVKAMLDAIAGAAMQLDELPDRVADRVVSSLGAAILTDKMFETAKRLCSNSCNYCVGDMPTWGEREELLSWLGRMRAERSFDSGDHK
jgi:hypothetical protein